MILRNQQVTSRFQAVGQFYPFCYQTPMERESRRLPPKGVSWGNPCMALFRRRTFWSTHTCTGTHRMHLRIQLRRCGLVRPCPWRLTPGSVFGFGCQWGAHSFRNGLVESDRRAGGIGAAQVCGVQADRERDLPWETQSSHSRRRRAG
jgi:hypothetical protein